MKKIILTLLVLSNIFLCDAQLKISSGGTYMLGSTKKYVDAEGSSGSIELYGVSVWARKFLGEESKITVGIPASAMLEGSVGSQGTGISFGIDLPITAEYNFGLGSSTEEDSDGERRFGGFIGGGFGYTYTSNSYGWSIPGVVSVSDRVKGVSYGPLVHAGIRFSTFGRAITTRLMFKKGLEKAKFTTIGLSVLYGL